MAARFSLRTVDIVVGDGYIHACNCWLTGGMCSYDRYNSPILIGADMLSVLLVKKVGMVVL